MDRFEELKLRVKEASDLVALIESYLPLKPRGRLLLALCPFHGEKSPSFTVYPDSQHYHCFGCGKHGDVFTFLQEREGLTFREAMELLADRANISLEGAFARGPQQDRRGPDPQQVLGEVCASFQKDLFGAAGGPARDYLANRGLLSAAEDWQLGYHAPGALATLQRQRRLPTAVLEEAGLLRNGREPFAGRLIFPIQDERGRLVAFGGRLLPGAPVAAPPGGFEPPKYVNSPESPFFSKRRVLYGLHRAKQAGERRIVVVEGYTDVIACHLAGFRGAVATLGTAFTNEHGKKLERYATEGVVLLFDGDRAGQQAAERASRELVNSPLQVRIALMSGAKDPADVLVERPGEDPDLVIERRARFEDLLAGAEDWISTWFRLLRRRLDLAQAAQFEAAARECGTLLGLVESELRRTALLQEMARHLAVPPEHLQRLVRVRAKPEPRAEGRGDRPAAAPAPTPARPRSPSENAEIDLLACVVAAPGLHAGVAGDSFAGKAIAELVGMVGDAIALGRTDGPAVQRYLFTRCAEQEAVRGVLAEACRRATTIADPGAHLEELQRGRHRLRGRAEARTLRQRLQAALDAGDRETADRLTHELVQQMRRQQPRANAAGDDPGGAGDGGGANVPDAPPRAEPSQFSDFRTTDDA